MLTRSRMNRINYVILYRECLKRNAYKDKRVNDFDKFINLTDKMEISFRHYIASIFSGCATRRNAYNVSTRISDYPGYDKVTKVRQYMNKLDFETRYQFMSILDRFHTAVNRCCGDVKNKTNRRTFVYFQYPRHNFLGDYLENFHLVKEALDELIAFSTTCFDEHVRGIIEQIEEERRAAEAAAQERHRLWLKEREEQRQNAERREAERRAAELRVRETTAGLEVIENGPQEQQREPITNERLQEMVDAALARRRSA